MRILQECTHPKHMQKSNYKHTYSPGIRTLGTHAKSKYNSLIRHMEHAVTMRKRIDCTLAVDIRLYYKVSVSSCQLTARRPGRYHYLKHNHKNSFHTENLIFTTELGICANFIRIKLQSRFRSRVLLLSLPAGFLLNLRSVIL